jgi:hypothetical protein
MPPGTVERCLPPETFTVYRLLIVCGENSPSE